MIKYLIYKISGGLNHMLIQINNAIHLSKITNRYLIIDCNAGAFKNDFNKYFNIPDFDYSIDYDCLYPDLINPEIEFYNKETVKWTENGYFLDDKLVSIQVKDIEDNDKIVYTTYLYGLGSIPWYIKVNKNIMDVISKNKINEKYIGIHYRNTDLKNKLETILPQIQRLSLLVDLVYLGTDDYTAYDRLAKLADNKFKIIQYTKPFNNEGKNIHYGNPNKDEVIMNTLIDMFHLMYATYFIPSPNTSFSRRILELRKEDNFFR
jgi:hypothetical protein